MISKLCYLTYIGIQIIRLFIFLLALIILIGALKPFFEGYESNPVLKQIYSINTSISAKVDKPIRQSMPTFVGGRDVAPWIKFIFLIAVVSFLMRPKNTLKYLSKYYKQKDLLNQLKSNDKIPANATIMKELENKMKEVEGSKRRNESIKLLEDYISLKKKVEERIKTLTFLSIDVIGSTMLKEKEDRTKIQYDFLQYNQNLKDIMEQNHCLKASWTPDGVMACFEKADDAMNAAKEIVEFVNVFNEKLKNISYDFHVRYGIHSGKVYYDDTLNLEEITDEVIDIAGHLQKYGEEDTIMISKNTYNTLTKRDNITKTEINVDGVMVYKYKKPNDTAEQVAL